MKRLTEVNEILSHVVFEMGKDVVITEGINDPYIFKALFTAGGPGSGKTYISKHAVQGLGLKFLNSDIAFEKLMKMQGVSMKLADPNSPLGQTQQTIRGQAKAIATTQRHLWTEGMLGLVIDGTGKDYNKLSKQADILKKMGYDVGMIFVNTSLETALRRNAKRARSVPEDMVKEMWHQVQDNLGKFQQFFGAENMIIIDSNDEKEGADEQAFGIGLRKMGLKWLGKPLKNSIGRKIIEKLKATGGKTLSDLDKE